jgi:hypothetical protein
LSEVLMFTSAIGAAASGRAHTRELPATDASRTCRRGQTIAARRKKKLWTHLR